MILKHSRIFSLIILLLSAQLTWAVDASYYSSASGKTGSTLRDALYTITSVGPANGHNYNNLWTAYLTTDVYPAGHANAGKIWDMYSDCLFTAGGSGSGGQCGNYSNVCDCYNREHSLPKSWFNEANPAYYDMGHIVPTDGKVNGQRSNYMFGEVSGGETWGTGKLGTSKSITTANTIKNNGGSITTSLSSTAFEPADKYKGDFARMYMYMVIRYKPGNSDNVNLAASGDGQKMFNSTDTYYGLTEYSIALLLKWHRQDPVSQKEIDRNNGMEMVQGNRNPFIDYPILAEYLWGKYYNETFNTSSATGSFEEGFTVDESDGDGASSAAKITISTTEVDFGKQNKNSSTQKAFTITGSYLSSSITIAKSGTDQNLFTITPTSIMTGYNSTKNITVTYTPGTNTGTHSATLTISSNGATSKSVTLSGKCTTVYTATWMADDTEYETTTAESDDSPDVPDTNPAACSSDRVFKGWTSNSSYSSNDGTGIFTTTAPAITEPTTFYAVYADKEGDAGESVYAKVTSTSDITDGQYLLVYEDGSVAMNGGLASLDVASNTISVSIDNSQIEITEATEAAEFTINKTAGTIQSASGYYIGQTSNSNGMNTSESTAYTNTLSISDNSFSCVSSGGAYLRYNSANDQKRFRYFKSSSYTGQKAVQLYKKMSGTATYSNYSTQCSEGTKVTITFNANGGEGTMAAQQVPQSTSRNLNSNTFTRTHYTFNGWNTQANGSGTPYADGASVNTSTDLTLYAQWTEASQYTVTFKNNGVTYATKTNYEGETITDVADPTACEGYTFEGWSTQTYAADNTDAVDIDYTGTIPASNTTYYAVYSKTESGGSGSSSTSNITASASLVSGITTSGYTFATDKNGGSSNPTYSDTGGDVRLYAKNQITISASSSITQIVFNVSTQGKKRLAPITASDGTIATQNSGDETVTWTGSATSITFTVGDNANYGSDGSSKAGQLCFTSVDITSGSGSSTTYYTTSPNCCTATLTVQSDDTMGEVTIE